MSTSEGLGGGGGGEASASASSAAPAATAAPASPTGSDTAAPTGSDTASPGQATTTAPAAPEAAAAAAAPTEASPGTSGEAPAETPWSGEVAGLETATWFASLTDDIKAMVKSGIQQKISNLERMGADNAAKAKQSLTEAQAEAGRVASDRQALQTEMREARQAIEADRARIRQMLTNPPENGEEAVAQARVTEEAAAQLSAAEVELTEARAAIEAAEAAKQMSAQTSLRLQQQLAEAADQIQIMKHDLEAAQQMARQIQSDRLEEVIRQVDPDILADGNEAAFDELARGLSVYGDEPFTEEDLAREIKKVRAVHPIPGAPKDVPASMAAMASGGTASPAAVVGVEKDYHRLVRQKQEDIHRLARSRQA